MSIIEWIHFIVLLFISMMAVHEPFGVDEFKMINERIQAYYQVLDETNREKLKIMKNKLSLSIRTNQILESKYRRLSRNFSSLWRLVNNNNRDRRSMYGNQHGAPWINESFVLPTSPMFVYTTAQTSTSPISPDTQYMDPTSPSPSPTQTPFMESATHIPNYCHFPQCNQNKI